MARETLKRVEWKIDYGIAVHVGIDDTIPLINEIAAWLNERHSMPLYLLDDCMEQKSVLSGLKAIAGNYYKAPPSIQGNVKLYAEPQELRAGEKTLRYPIKFLSVPTRAQFGLNVVSEGVRENTIIFGTPDACADVLEAASLSAQPIFYCGGMLAVRAA